MDHSIQPTKRTAAGMLIMGGEGRVLLVNPTYKPAWEIPGGIVEENEAPRAAARREVCEEIGIDIEPGRLLSLDYRHASSRRHIDILRFIFWGGVLSPAKATEICLQVEELSEWGFFTLAEAQTRLTPDLGRVVAGCLDILDGAETQYVEYARQGVVGWWPLLADPVDFAGALTSRDPIRLLPYEAASDSALSLGATVHGQPHETVFSISLMIGPEGGFDAAEIQAAQAAGWRIITLGPRILRAETAALAAISVVMERAGEMG